MNIGNYPLVMFASATCLLLTAMILFAVRVPSDRGKNKLRIAKYSLAIASLVLGAVNMVQLFVDPRATITDLSRCMTLILCYPQALLFTMTAMVLIRPSVVTMRGVWLQVAAIACADALLLAAFFTLPRQWFLGVFIIGIVGYVLQLFFYTRWYMAHYRAFLRQIEAYYEEDEIDRRLRWIVFIFWSALTIGVVIMVMFVGMPEIDIWVTPLLAVLYASYAVWFINYLLETPLILPALYDDATEEAEPMASTAFGIESTSGTKSRLEQWIDEKGYLRSEQSIKEIAAEVGMSIVQLHQHFRDVVGEEFRTWRIRKRIEESIQLMDDHPEYPTSQIVQMAGFKDRSYFYLQFQRFTGMTVQDYREQNLSKH
ncbi:MAG: helix-turn-helix transcriptional regulator [Prevotella sp.]|nr:helix-turn-helix transcriptional regulator [Prevotella sp.]